MRPAPRRKLPRAVTWLLLFAAFVEIGLPVCMALARNRLMFFPAAEPLPDDPISHAAVPIRLVRVVRPDGRKLAAYDHLVADGVPASRIVVFGESIGGAPAIFVATQRRVAGVATQSTFSSLSSIALRLYPWMPLGALLVAGAFPNADRIATLDVPVLIVHGRADRIVPFAEGERLAAALPKAEFLALDGADHNDLFDVAGDDYLRGLGERFRRWTAR